MMQRPRIVPSIKKSTPVKRKRQKKLPFVRRRVFSAYNGRLPEREEPPFFFFEEERVKRPRWPQHKEPKEEQLLPMVGEPMDEDRGPDRAPLPGVDEPIPVTHDKPPPGSNGGFAEAYVEFVKELAAALEDLSEHIPTKVENDMTKRPVLADQFLNATDLKCMAGDNLRLSLYNTPPEVLAHQVHHRVLEETGLPLTTPYSPTEPLRLTALPLPVEEKPIQEIVPSGEQVPLQLTALPMDIEAVVPPPQEAVQQDPMLPSFPLPEPVPFNTSMGAPMPLPDEYYPKPTLDIYTPLFETATRLREPGDDLFWEECRQVLSSYIREQALPAAQGALQHVVDYILPMLKSIEKSLRDMSPGWDLSEGPRILMMILFGSREPMSWQQALNWTLMWSVKTGKHILLWYFGWPGAAVNVALLIAEAFYWNPVPEWTWQQWLASIGHDFIISRLVAYFAGPVPAAGLWDIIVRIGLGAFVQAVAAVPLVLPQGGVRFPRLAQNMQNVYELGHRMWTLFKVCFGSMFRTGVKVVAGAVTGLGAMGLIQAGAKHYDWDFSSLKERAASIGRSIVQGVQKTASDGIEYFEVKIRQIRNRQVAEQLLKVGKVDVRQVPPEVREALIALLDSMLVEAQVYALEGFESEAFTPPQFQGPNSKQMSDEIRLGLAILKSETRQLSESLLYEEWDPVKVGERAMHLRTLSARIYHQLDIWKDYHVHEAKEIIEKTPTTEDAIAGALGELMKGMAELGIAAAFASMFTPALPAAAAGLVGGAVVYGGNKLLNMVNEYNSSPQQRYDTAYQLVFGEGDLQLVSKETTFVDGTKGTIYQVKNHDPALWYSVDGQEVSVWHQDSEGASVLFETLFPKQGEKERPLSPIQEWVRDFKARGGSIDESRILLEQTLTETPDKRKAFYAEALNAGISAALIVTRILMDYELDKELEVVQGAQQQLDQAIHASGIEFSAKAQPLDVDHFFEFGPQAWSGNQEQVFKGHLEELDRLLAATEGDLVRLQQQAPPSVKVPKAGSFRRSMDLAEMIGRAALTIANQPSFKPWLQKSLVVGRIGHTLWQGMHEHQDRLNDKERLEIQQARLSPVISPTILPSIAGINARLQVLMEQMLQAQDGRELRGQYQTLRYLLVRMQQEAPAEEIESLVRQYNAFYD